MPGYDVIPDLRADRQDTAGGVGGGLLVYAKHGMQILPLDTHSNLTQHVGFKIVTEGESLDVVLIYRPPRNCMDSYQKLAQLIAGSGPRTFVIGDLNLPTIDWEKGEARGAGPELVLDACNDKFMEQLVQFETHLRSNCLDLILTNAPDMVSDVKNEGRLGSSDHYMISAKISANLKRCNSTATVKNW
jgi:hypothetical protein